MRRHGDTAIRRYGDTAMRRYGDAAIRRYGDTAIRRYGDTATRRHGDAAAAHATDANLAPVSTKAAKWKAKKARRRTKALSATSESSSALDFSNLAELQKAVVDEEKVLMKKAAFSGDDSSAAAAAHATDANLVPVSTKAAKWKAKKARRRAKALSATSESSSAPPIQFPYDPWSNAPAYTDDSQYDLGTSSTEYNY